MFRLIAPPIVSGMIATGGMTAVLWAISRSGWTNADMVRAIGSLVTRSYENALGVGLVVHFINGVIIAAVYLQILSLLRLASLPFEIFVGGVMGFSQGFVVGLVIVKIAYRHPIEQFKRADYKVASAHIVGHVVYGLLIGTIYGFMRVSGFDVSPGV